MLGRYVSTVNYRQITDNLCKLTLNYYTYLTLYMSLSLLEFRRAT